jgi:adenylosuccinate synthase
MSLDIVVGTQWGDEGKGRVVDLLATKANYVARFNGGDNAGHTVTVENRTFKLHLIPSGIIHSQVIGVIGNGLVVNPKILIAEMQMLEKQGIPINPNRLRISNAAHVITPGHLAIDNAREIDRGDEKIGTTLRGIGPAYNDKTARFGIRMQSLLSQEDLADKIEAHIETVNKQLISIYNQNPLDPISVAQEYAGYARLLEPYIGDISLMLTNALDRDQVVLAEGAQGTLLDLDHGTYPFVTSSNPTAPGVLLGLGIGLRNIGRIIGVTKAFQTRVGEGPFPTEVFDDTAIQLRGTGENPWDEFGTTTGRPRRVGWLDSVLLRYAVRVNGLNELTVTKMDILSGINPLQICVKYKTRDQIYHELPLGPSDLSPFEPIYEELPGWDTNITGIRRWNDLPSEVKAYLNRIQELVNVPIKMVSVGPERDQIVKMN